MTKTYRKWFNSHKCVISNDPQFRGSYTMEIIKCTLKTYLNACGSADIDCRDLEVDMIKALAENGRGIYYVVEMPLDYEYFASYADAREFCNVQHY